MNDVARQATEAERKTSTEKEQGSNECAYGAKNQKGPSEFAEWVHEASVKPANFEVKASEAGVKALRGHANVNRFAMKLKSVRARRKSS